MLLELNLLVGCFIYHHVQHNYEKILMFELDTFTVLTLRYLAFNLLIVIALVNPWNKVYT